LLDVNLIRRQPDAVREALARRGGGVEGGVDAVLELDGRRRELLPRLEGLRA
jgi:seryl-tRNA synthetase